MSDDRKKMVVYTIFEKCTDYTLDEYWKDIFHMCATNKFPKGLRYDENRRVLYIRIEGNRTETVNVPTEATEAFPVIMDVFKTYMNLLSPHDLTQKKEHMKDLLQISSLSEFEWKQIRSKIMKESLIGKYVYDLKEEHDLSVKESKTLFALINLGFQFKKLTSENITFDDGYIKNISGIDYNEDTKVFTLVNDGKITPKSSKSSKSDAFYSSIERYIKDYEFRKSKLHLSHINSTSELSDEEE